jgi:hypothetical protein
MSDIADIEIDVDAHLWSFVIYLLLLVIYCYRSFILLIARFSSILCSTFVHYSLFKRKRFNSDPGLYSRYFDPV